MQNATDAELIKAVERYRTEHGLSQQAIAGRIGCNQGHLSKVLAGKVRLSRFLRPRLASLAADRPTMPGPSGPTAAEVLDALDKSQDFRDMVQAALRIVHKNA